MTIIQSGSYSLVFLLFLAGCNNPFAPPLDDGSFETELATRSPKTIDGFYEAFKVAYRFQDTTLYGQLIDEDFLFTFHDFDRGIDVTWGRSEEMKSTFGLFNNSEQLELEWSYYRDFRVDSTSAVLSRAFTLRVVFSSVDIVQGDGIARFELIRERTTDPWKLTAWVDESDF